MCSEPTTSRPPAPRGCVVRVTFVHVARNALIPTVTLLGINIAYLIGGTVVIERVFALNGSGSAIVGPRSTTVTSRRASVTLVYALGVIVVILITDLVFPPTARSEPGGEIFRLSKR